MHDLNHEKGLLAKEISSVGKCGLITWYVITNHGRYHLKTIVNQLNTF